MRFIHTADIHLGATPESKMDWAVHRGDEMWGTFERLIKKVKEDEIELLIIAGDLFHRQPLLRELKEVDYLFSTIPDTKVVLCAGNHDAIKKGSFYRNFEWNKNVYFLDSKTVDCVPIDDLGVDVYGLSYYKNEITEPLYDDIQIKNPYRINILVAHGGDDKHIPINKRKIMLEGFDYVAFGHIHIPDLDEANRMAYSGSLEPIDVNEIGPRGFIYGEVTKQNLNIRFQSFSKREYKHAEMTVTTNAPNMELRHTLMEFIEKEGRDNIYKVTIVGYRNPDFDIDLEGLAQVGNVVSVMDRTEPDYDFEELYERNKDNLLGMFIKKYIDQDVLSPIQQKTLYYGVKALLEAMEDKQ